MYLSFSQLECSAGTYGTRCENLCSGNCLESQACNFVNGFCDQGCKSGWTGPRCQLCKYVY